MGIILLDRRRLRVGINTNIVGILPDTLPILQSSLTVVHSVFCDSVMLISSSFNAFDL